eukprot:Skav225149  [mRNA]  locus=scaffold1056:256626:264231:- [translate_table: standard]
MAIVRERLRTAQGLESTESNKFVWSTEPYAEDPPKGRCKLPLRVVVSTLIIIAILASSCTIYIYLMLEWTRAHGETLQLFNDPKLTLKSFCLAKHYGVGTLCSHATREKLPAHFFCRKLDLVKVKGKEEAVWVYDAWRKGTRDQGLSGLAVSRCQICEDIQAVPWHGCLKKSESMTAIREHTKAY